MNEIQSSLVAVYRCGLPGLKIESLNSVAATHGAAMGDRLAQVYEKLDERRLLHRLERKQSFSQVITASKHGAVEVRVRLGEGGVIHVEVLPADAVRDTRLTMDRHVRRVEELSHHLQQFPESNPNPVLRASLTGEVLYANPAAVHCLAEQMPSRTQLPDDLLQGLDRDNLVDFDYQCGDLWYSVRPAWSRVLDCYLLYLTDITSVRRNETILKNLARYFSPRVAQSIVSHEGDIQVQNQRKHLTVFFSDLVGFSAMAETMALDDLSEFLFDYLTLMTEIAEQHGGTVDKYVGDSIMIFFGDPRSKGRREDALACASMALAMRAGLADLNEAWAVRGIAHQVEMRMGMHSALCAVGNFGSKSRLAYTAFGNGVNIAARLEGIARAGTITCSSVTAELIEDEFLIRQAGVKQLRNISDPVTVFELVDRRR